jgi:hypothetical protein
MSNFYGSHSSAPTNWKQSHWAMTFSPVF